MGEREDRTATLERLARLADGTRADGTPTDRSTNGDPDVPTTQPRAGSNRRYRTRAAARRVGPFATGVLAVLVGLVAYAQLVPGGRPLTSADIDARVASVLASAVPGPAYSELVFGTIAPSLVLITTFGSELGGLGGEGLGSGVVVTDEGMVLTALHVVEEATEITLTFSDGSSRWPAIVHQQPDKDIAVLQADDPPRCRAGRRCWATRTCPSAARPTSWATPTASIGSMSAGVISGRGRTFQASGPRDDHHRPHPGRRRRQSRQLRRPAARPGRPGASASSSRCSTRPTRTSSSASAWPCPSTPPAGPAGCCPTETPRRT